MAWRVTPSVIVGLGQSGEHVIQVVKREVESHEVARDLMDIHRLYQFTPVFLKECLQASCALLGGLRERIEFLRSYPLPTDEGRYEIPGAEADVYREINIFIVGDLEDEDSKLLPAFVKRFLQEKREGLTNLCLLLSVARFGGEVTRRTTEPLNEIESLLGGTDARVYLIDREVNTGTRISTKEELLELLSLFLQSLLLAHDNPQTAFLRANREGASNFAALGLSTVDFPTAQLIDYCARRTFCELVNALTQETENNVTSESKNWVRAIDLKPSVASIEDPPRSSPKGFPLWASNAQLKQQIHSDIGRWHGQLSTWSSEKIKEIEEHGVHIRREGAVRLTKKTAEFKERADLIFSSNPNGLYLAGEFMKHTLEHLKTARKERSLPRWHIPQRPSLDYLDSLKERAFSLIDRRPNAKAVIFHTSLFFLVALFLLVNILASAHGLVTSLLYSLVSVSALSFMAVFFILLLPHWKSKRAYSALGEDLHSYSESVRTQVRESLNDLAKAHEIRGLERLLLGVQDRHKKADLSAKYLKAKSRSIAEEEIKKVVENRFRRYVASDEDFPSIFRERTGGVTPEEVGDHLRENFSFTNLIDLTHDELFSSIYVFIEDAYAPLRRFDWFSVAPYKGRLARALTDMTGKIPFYVAPEQIGRAGGSGFLFVAQEEYHRFFDEFRLTSPDPVVFRVPLIHPHRISLMRVMWDIDLKS